MQESLATDVGQGHLAGQWTSDLQLSVKRLVGLELMILV